MREQALKEMDEQHRLKLLEKEQQVETLRRQIEDLKTQCRAGLATGAGRGPGGRAGGIAQEPVPDRLHRAGAPRAFAGADVIQRVFDDSGMDCGLILWESKRTRHWSKDWLPKLRDDLRMVGASRSVIVSEQLPEHVRHFGQVDGVWVVKLGLRPSGGDHAARESGRRRQEPPGPGWPAQQDGTRLQLSRSARSSTTASPASSRRS